MTSSFDPKTTATDGLFTFPLQLRVEKPDNRDQRPEEFDIMVPVLDVVLGAFSIHSLKPVRYQIGDIYVNV